MKRASLISIFISFFCATGCSVLTSYPQQTQAAQNAFEQGRFQEAMLLLPRDPGGPDELLYRLERGVIAHTAAKFNESNLELLDAVDVAKAYQDRPTISLRSGLEGAASLLINDKTLPYEGEGFERVWLHSYLALNFYFLGKIDDAFVESRLAYEVQREEEKKYGKSYTGQGAFGRYLSGLMRETVREPGEAYLDYKKVYELSPGCEQVKHDLLRLAKRLGYQDDWSRWKQDFGTIETEATQDLAKNGEFVFLFQCGVAPIKTPIEVLIPHEDGVTKFAMPQFQSRPNPVVSARLLVDGKRMGETSLLESVESVARENLDDRIGLLVAKAGIRTIGKGILTEKLEKKHGDWGALLGTLFAIVTEQADLRSWLSLPQSFQLLRVPISEGEHDFSIELLGANGNVVGQSQLGRVRIRPTERVVLNLRSIGISSFASFVGGERVQPRSQVSP